MAQAVPGEEIKAAHNDCCVDDALTEKLTSVTNAANVISSMRKDFTELKSFANPPIVVKEILAGLHAFKENKPVKNVSWADIKKGPIFKS